MNTDGSALTDVVGYRIYYGTSATNLTQTTQVSGATTTNVVIGGLAAGTYFFSVAALNSTGVVSDPSNAVSRPVP